MPADSTLAARSYLVIGAGVVGVCLAARLAQAGAAVTLLDAAGPGHGATRSSFAWLNSNDKAPRAYHDLNHAGMRAWAELAPDLDGDAWYRPAGHLELATANAATLEIRVRRLTGWNYPARLVDAAEAARLEPALRIPAGAVAAFFPEEGYLLTVTARKPESIQQAAERLRERGFTVQDVVANVASEEGVREVVTRHRDRYGRLDVLVNNAGVGVGAPAEGHVTKLIDMQLAVNVRAIVLFYRECADLLRAAGAEHGNAVVVNLASIAGKSPQPWLSVYSATKAAVAAYTVAMNKEFAKHGVKSVAFAPGFVDTDMTDYVKGKVPAEEMLRTSDVTEALRFVLRVSPMCLIPEIVFQRAGEIV